MPALRTPPRLYLLCLDLLGARYQRLGLSWDWEDTSIRGPLDTLACKLVEDLLLRAYSSATRGKRAADGAGSWNYDWQVFFTPKIQSAVIIWDQHLLKVMAVKCKSLIRALVSRWKNFHPQSLAWLPTSLLTLDFDGELFFRGRRGPALQHVGAAPSRWLPEAGALFKALHVWRQKPLMPDPIRGATPAGSALAELHLGTVHVTAADIRTLLTQHPNLRLLRHYQLVTALCELHADQWRQGDNLPHYKLRNLDVDFSHVIRCRMSPQAVLPSDALQLAVRLCPDATMVRVRYDCSTPHDVLAPLTTLHRLRELSIVCVSSGERTLLDFSDMAPILEQHGLSYLASLELKVIEEVDVHVILTCCPRLERLVLSGCGNVTPPTCDRYPCDSLALPRLRLLFFADGDDFSWDHALPQCFWPATLGAASRQQGRADASAPPRSRLEGIFLESPRISASTLADVLAAHRGGRRLFPELQVLSLCRYPELSLPELAALCGADVPGSRTALRYVRASQCEQIGAREERGLRGLLASCRIREDVVITTQ